MKQTDPTQNRDLSVDQRTEEDKKETSKMAETIARFTAARNKGAFTSDPLEAEAQAAADFAADHSTKTHAVEPEQESADKTSMVAEPEQESADKTSMAAEPEQEFVGQETPAPEPATAPETAAGSALPLPDSMATPAPAESAAPTGITAPSSASNGAPSAPEHELINTVNKNKKWLIPAIIAAAVLIIAATGSLIGYKKYQAYQAKQQQLAAEDAELKSEAYMLAIDTFHKHAVEDVSNGSGEEVAQALAQSGLLTLQGIQNRPPYVELTSENSAEFASLDSVLINSDTGMVDVNVTAAALPESDDGYYYLFSEAMYEDEISGEPITKIEKDVDFTISCNLKYNTSESRLFDKFCVAVLKDGEYLKVSAAKYITNPSAIASCATSLDGTESKKGLLIDATLLNSGQLGDLGVKHAAYNVYTSLILNGSGINYTYNGHTYSFNAYQVGLYDIVFSSLTKQGIDANAIIINDLSNSEITHPGARGTSATLYAFNAEDEDGINAIAALGSFLAHRYNGSSGHGKVSNWIIGNEVNERTIYNMMPYMSVGEYAQAYADVVRVFYNSMASVNATTRVYLSLDQRWDMNKSDNTFYDVKDMLDAFNSCVVKEGNFEWNVGFHPYNYPLTVAKAWNMGRYDGYVTNSVSTSIISIRNIHVLTDYLSQSAFLDPDGNIRHVVLSEMGYTSSQGQDLQAASFVYAYKIMMANSKIDYMLLSRQVDASSEVSQGLAMGLLTSGHSKKTIYDVYKYMGTGSESEYADRYLSTVGISSWSQITNPR